MVSRKHRQKIEDEAVAEIAAKLSRRRKVRTAPEVRLAKQIAYLITRVSGIRATDNAGTFYGEALATYLREERKSVFGYIQPSREERQAIDEWMDRAIVGDVLVGENRLWSITVVSTERESLQTLEAVKQAPIYSAVSLRGKKQKKGKL